MDGLSHDDLPVDGLSHDDLPVDGLSHDDLPVDGPDPEHPGATGDPRVDDAIALLEGVDALPTADRVAVFDDVQRRLHSALGSLDPNPAE